MNFIIDIGKKLVVLASFISTTALADDVYFYRADSRPPQTIFSTGFVVLGQNNNLLRHVEGESCFTGTRDSLFTSTTASQSFAIDWGDRRQDFYVYAIRPTSNFFRVYDSLNYAAQQSGDPEFTHRARFFQEQDEWVALGNITPQQIYRAIRYTRTPDGIAVAHEASYNQRYEDIQTAPSSTPYTIWYPINDSSSSDSCYECASNSSASARLRRSTAYPNTQVLQLCSRSLIYNLLGDAVKSDESGNPDL
ncbi:enterotoxin A family protein [Budvicia diplopodorum]|uniref:enterotoxin A family protein n=1 Tax=Budvicia diplopodorum TaxID=1119056 RepID=UPI00135B3029|nr:enterotoxin A family protein [Budvicia diplopodorum]